MPDHNRTRTGTVFRGRCNFSPTAEQILNFCPGFGKSTGVDASMGKTATNLMIKILSLYAFRTEHTA
mgnify:FL=1